MSQKFVFPPIDYSKYAAEEADRLARAKVRRAKKIPYQRRPLDLAIVQKRVASAAWKEVIRLLTRNLSPEAKDWALLAQKHYQDISLG